MIPINAFTVNRLQDLEAGDIFVQGDDQAAFLRGHVGDFEVYLALGGGRHPFTFAKRESWNNRRGFIMKGIQFEVDPSAAVAKSTNAESVVGELTRFPEGYGIGGRDQHLSEFVILAGKFNGDEEPRHIVSFARWQITLTLDGSPHALFHYDGGTWASGPLKGAL